MVVPGTADAGSYEERYKSHLESSSSQWVQYITKEVPGDVTRIDCGLYCEEYEPCDFFLQNDNCYLGTFQTNVSESGFTLEEQIRRITVYTVHKATHELTIAKEQFQAPVQYPYDLIKVFAYNAFDLSVLEHCPIFCLLQPRCHFYFTVEGQSVNCVIGLFAPTPSRSRIDMNLTQDVALVPIKGIDPANLLADGMGRGRTFGSCTGAGFHHVNGTDWKLRFNLRYNNGMNCYFVIYNYPLNAKLRMTVDRFNSEECCDYLKIYEGPHSSGPQLHSYKDSLGTIEYEWSKSIVTLYWHTDGSETRSSMDGIIEVVS